MKLSASLLDIFRTRSQILGNKRLTSAYVGNESKDARYGELEPFGREDTAQELTDHSVQESDEMVDQLERAEVRRSVPASGLSPCVFCMF